MAGFEELAESERLSRSIIDSLQQALIVIDTTGRITRCNEAAAELCGVSLGELTPGDGGDLQQLLGAADRAMYERKSGS
jgi:PAS domain-containing protein